MYAIVETGGKQYLVEPGQKIKVEKLLVNVGDTVTISQVLLAKEEGNIIVGKPYIDTATVLCKVVAQDRAKKIIVRKYRAKKGYKKTIGHRQYYTELKVEEIRTKQTAETTENTEKKTNEEVQSSAAVEETKPAE